LWIEWRTRNHRGAFSRGMESARFRRDCRVLDELMVTMRVPPADGHAAGREPG